MNVQPDSDDISGTLKENETQWGLKIEPLRTIYRTLLHSIEPLGSNQNP